MFELIAVEEAGEKVPGTHWRQEDMAGAGANEPEWQGEHEVAPLVEEMVPGGHMLQIEEPELVLLKNPGRHGAAVVCEGNKHRTSQNESNDF